jgi:predicted nucleotidyltransferase
MSVDPRIEAEVAEQPHRLVFVPLSGAHLYGFPSPDSDWDLRGVHVLPVREVVGLDGGRETIEVMHVREGAEIDLVTHDAKKFFQLLLKRNGYALEQVLSPLVVRTSPEHEELAAIARRCPTRHHWHHYLGFAETQRVLLAKGPPRVKPLLYLYRVLLTGIHLMRTGEVEASLVRLNDAARLPGVAELIARKLAGPEKGAISAADLAFHEAQLARLRAELEEAGRLSKLPEVSPVRDELDALLVRLRLATV